MATAALILMTLASSPHPAPPLVSATLVGFLPQGDVLVLETKRGGEAILRRMSHDGARTELLERERPASLSSWLERRTDALGVRAPTPLPRERDRWRIHELELVLIEEAPLGGRRFVELEARRGHRAITVWRMPVLDEARVGPLYLVPNTATLLITYAQGRRRGLDRIDVSLARAALLNLEAIDHFRAGERARAAALLEEAISIAPHAGDAAYNLACLHSRMGQLQRAKGELQIALGIDRVRFRLLARDDPDLEPLLADPEVRRWLGLEDVD
jgi:tetratricopeptide (TPR) repeat protein